MRGKLNIAAVLALWCASGHAQIAPSVSASAVSPSQISVSYTNVSEGYATRIFRNGTPVFTSPNSSFTFIDQPLSANTTYSYCGMTGTWDEVGNFIPYTGCGNTASATTFGPPAAPSSLNASGSGTQINLAWTDGSGNESGFLIERKTGSGGTFSQIASVGANVTSYSNTGLTADTSYFYRVRSTNAYGSSGYANTASATTAPLAPTGLTATAASGTQINLAWTDTSSTETGFKVERKTGSGGTYVQIAALAAGATSYSDTGLASGTTYFYRVRDANLSGDSAYSSEANASLAAMLTLSFIEVDHLNTPRAVYDANQQLRWKWDQAEPFGVNTPNEDPSSLGAHEFSMRFPGQYADAETHLSYNSLRDYDAAIGRYEQSDLIGLRGGLNTYSYTSANPTGYSDPTGLVRWTGTSYTVSLSTLVGASYTEMDLFSECACGKRYHILVHAAGPSVGFGVNFSATVSDASFDDGQSCPTPSAFIGPYKGVGAGATFGALPVKGMPSPMGLGLPGIGASAGISRFGGVTSDFNIASPASTVYGRDMSVSGTVGSSTVTVLDVRCCGK